MSGLDLTGIRARAAAATAGPWTTGRSDEVRRLVADVGGMLTVYSPGDAAWPKDFHAQAHADAEFIRHARADVPQLVAEVDRLRALLAEATR